MLLDQNRFEYQGTIYDVTWESEDTRHGGPFDRGSADSYYARRPSRHFYTGATGSSDIVMEDMMTDEEKKAYDAGFEYNETVVRDWKVW